MIQEPKTISPPPIDVANTDTPSKLLSQVIFFVIDIYQQYFKPPSLLFLQNVAPQRVYANILMEDEKVATLGLPDQLPSPQGLFQVASLAMDRAIKEIVSGIVQRSVCIACQTTKELVLKDYALEPDEARIYSAAHMMVASLAGNFAHVTCKEPLRTSISGHLRNSLQGLNIKNEALEQIVQVVTNDNLDMGCAAIEQAATGKALQTIDADIAQQLLLRRDGAGSSLSQNSVSFIPESLRRKPGQLSLSLQRVYEVLFF
ncbi:hypothetical protein Bca101_039936 [Brassica carinata]